MTAALQAGLARGFSSAMPVWWQGWQVVTGSHQGLMA